MDVKEIIVEYLKANNYDGLVQIDAECGCELDDVFVCDYPSGHCEPGYKMECKCGEDCGWHMIAPDSIKENAICFMLSLASIGVDIEWRHH